MKKKLLSTFLCFLMVFSVFSGCTTPANDQEPLPNDAEQPATGNADGDQDYWRRFAGTELTLAVQVGHEGDYVESIMGDFEEKTGIHVTVEKLPQEQLWQKIQIDTMSKSGSLDCFAMDMMRVTEYAKAGYIESIDKYINDPSLTDLEAYQIDDILAGPLSAGQYQGVQYGVPYTAETSLLMYRKDVFEKYGIESVPETFDELIEVLDTIQGDPDVYPIGMRGQRGAGMNIYTWTQVFRGFGGDFFVDFPNDMTPTVNTPEAIAATEFYAELINKYGPPGSGNWTNMEIYTAQANGDIAMTMDANAFGAVIENQERSQTVGKWGYAVVPGGEGGRWPAIYAHMFCINSYSKNKEAAWLLLQYLTLPEVDLKKGVASGMPIRESSWNNEELQEKLYHMGEGEYAAACLESMKIGDGQYRPIFENWTEMGDILGIAVQDVITGGDTAENALNEAQAEIESMLKKNGYIS